MSELVQSREYKKNIWARMLAAWQKRSQTDAKVLLLDFPFFKAGLPDFTTTHFNHAYTKGAPTKEQGSNLTIPRQLIEYLGSTRNERSDAIREAADAESEYHKAYDKLDYPLSNQKPPEN